MPMCVFRRTDFASDGLVKYAMNMKNIDALETLALTESPAAEEALALLLYFVGMRGMEFAVACRKEPFTNLNRIKLLFAGYLLLMNFELQPAHRETLTLHTYGCAGVFAFLDPTACWKTMGTVYLELLIGAVRSMNGNRREVPVSDWLQCVKKAY